MKTLREHTHQVLSQADDRVFAKQLDGPSWTLIDLARDTKTLLDNLAKHHLTPKRKVVGIAMRSSYEWIVAETAMLEAEGIALPVPLDFSDSQITNLLGKADYCIVQNALVGERLKKMLPEQLLVLPSGEIFHQGRPKEVSAAHRLDEDIVQIIHTSGTTSHPKGVMIRDDAVGLLVENLLLKVGSKRPLHYLSLVPMSLLIEQVLGIYMPLFSGGSVTFMPEGMAEFGSQSEQHATYLQLIARAQPNFLYLPPKLLEASLPMIKQRALASVFGYTIPHIITGGTKVNAELLTEFDTLGVPIYEAYGLSENSSVISINTPGQRRIGSAGKLLPGITAKIEDGELLIKSPTLCAGYFNQDSTSCDITSDGYLKTGDIAYFDNEGFLHITGRKKHVIILSNARNVSPEWVEALFKSSTLIDDIIVFGDGMESLSAVILLTDQIEKEETNIEAEIARLNLDIPLFAQIRSYHIVENAAAFKANYFTVTGRPKRKEIFTDYAGYLYP